MPSGQYDHERARPAVPQCGRSGVSIAVIRRALACALFAGTVYVTAVELIEAYGAGAPYYGRTTNMDKWSNPWPLVAGIDVIAIGLIALLLRQRKAPLADMRHRR